MKSFFDIIIKYPSHVRAQKHRHKSLCLFTLSLSLSLCVCVCVYIYKCVRECVSVQMNVSFII